MGNDTKNRRSGQLTRKLAGFQLLSFLPLFVVAAYWSRSEAVLFVVTFMLPLLLAFQELLKKSTGTGNTSIPAVHSHDGLTGVATRADATKRLADFLASERNTGLETAVLHIDIDRFNIVNQRYGMEAGDKVLREIAERIQDCVRENDIVARIDGDEFAVVLYPIRRVDFPIALAIATRIRASLNKPVSIDHTSCYVTCAIGVCMSNRAPNRTAESVLSSAGVALNLARQCGPDATRSFSPKMRREAQKINDLSTDIEAALGNGQIRPWFQPQVCTDTGEIAGFEALARWEHPENGVILPELFLKAIESSGRCERLGEVILYHSLSALKSWDRSGFRVASIGVNFSSSELRNPKLVEKIKWEVDRFDIAPSRLTIEVLENVVSDFDDDVITRNIRALAALGFGIDLDDFGVGHAAISNIRRFAVNRIKIDRSFITRIDKDEEQQRITSAIIRMAESLGLETLAEGVETVGEHNRLSQLGCRYIQGFGIARPMPFEDTIPWIHAYRDRLAKGNDGTRKAG